MALITRRTIEGSGGSNGARRHRSSGDNTLFDESLKGDIDRLLVKSNPIGEKSLSVFRNERGSLDSSRLLQRTGGDTCNISEVTDIIDNKTHYTGKRRTSNATVSRSRTGYRCELSELVSVWQADPPKFTFMCEREALTSRESAWPTGPSPHRSSFLESSVVEDGFPVIITNYRFDRYRGKIHGYKWTGDPSDGNFLSGFPVFQDAPTADGWIIGRPSSAPPITQNWGARQGYCSAYENPAWRQRTGQGPQTIRRSHSAVVRSNPSDGRYRF